MSSRDLNSSNTLLFGGMLIGVSGLLLSALQSASVPCLLRMSHSHTHMHIHGGVAHLEVSTPTSSPLMDVPSIKTGQQIYIIINL